jgi:hypothetical protein
VMADSTNLRSAPTPRSSSTAPCRRRAQLSRHLDQADHRRVRFVTGHSDKGAYKIQTRSRPSACAAPSSISCPSAARPPWCCGTMGSAGLRPLLPVHRADQARRYRDHHLRRRQVHHPESSTPPWTSPAVPRRASATPPSMRTRRRPLRRRSTTAATPPACCAGADDGKVHPQSYRLGRAYRGYFAGSDSGADPHWHRRKGD